MESKELAVFKELFKNHEAIIFIDTTIIPVEVNTRRMIELTALKIEKGEEGTLEQTGVFDVFIKLPEGEKLPEKFEELTGITDAVLKKEGIERKEAAMSFAKMLASAPENTLLVAYDAQLDVTMLQELLGNLEGEYRDSLKGYDYLDCRTILKDRIPNPDCLTNAVLAYDLVDRVFDDSHEVYALYEVCKAMEEERADLEDYVNVFGFHPRYGVMGAPIDGVTYHPQLYRLRMVDEDNRLPVLAAWWN